MPPPRGIRSSSTASTLKGNPLYEGGAACVPSGNEIHIAAGRVGDTKAYISQSQVLYVYLTSAKNGDTWMFDPKQEQQHLGGDAQVTGGGNSYKITGHIAPYLHNDARLHQPPVPFEFDVTCS